MPGDAARANSPLAGLRVLVPRGGEWGDRAARLVWARGGVPIIAELIRFAPAADPAPLERGMRELAEGAYEWVVVTSPRAAEALLDGLGGAGHDGVEARVAAVGAATAAALAPLEVDFIPHADASAAALVAEWPDAPRASGRILWPRSAIASATVRDGLTARGYRVDDPIAYETHAVELDTETGAALRDGRIDAVLVTSGSVARALADARPHAAITIVTIGPVTTRDARSVGLEVSGEAAERSVPSLLDALEEHRRPAIRTVQSSPTPKES